MKLDESVIKETHKTITRNIDSVANIPGNYRNHEVKVGNRDHSGVYTPPKCLPDIQNLMKEFCTWMNSEEITTIGQGSPVALLSWAHSSFWRWKRKNSEGYGGFVPPPIRYPAGTDHAVKLLLQEHRRLFLGVFSGQKKQGSWPDAVCQLCIGWSHGCAPGDWAGSRIKPATITYERVRGISQEGESNNTKTTRPDWYYTWLWPLWNYNSSGFNTCFTIQGPVSRNIGADCAPRSAEVV